MSKRKKGSRWLPPDQERYNAARARGERIYPSAEMEAVMLTIVRAKQIAIDQRLLLTAQALEFASKIAGWELAEYTTGDPVPQELLAALRQLQEAL